ncbi:hypothetical protein BH11PSE11_BH11PSE11_37610 [soil metagenome]
MRITPLRLIPNSIMNLVRRLARSLLLILSLTSFGAIPSGYAASPASALPPPATAPAPGTITVSPASITYFAMQGDTLSSIAQKFTTRQENWAALAKLNGISKDNAIPVGTGIQIPAQLLADQPSEATVLALSGTISAKNAEGAVITLTKGTKVVEGMELDTGNNSFLTLSLPDASRITLPSNSRIKLAKLRVTHYTKSPRTELLLLDGRVESRVSPLESSQGRFEVRSSKSIAGVRGTHFRVSVTEAGTSNEVLSGKVVVGTPAQPEALTLDAGKGNLINGRTVGPATVLLPAPQLLDTDPQKKYASMEFALNPVAGAARYHVQIAADQEAQQILAESYAPKSLVTVDPAVERRFANGNYFVRISAIDASGIEGHAQTRPFAFHASAHASNSAAASSAAPSVASSTSKEVTLKWLPQAGKRFALQVARDPEFTWLQFKTNTDAAEARLPRPAFGTYYARVRSINADGSENPYSPVQAFIVTEQWVINDGNPVGSRDTQSGALTR